MAQKRKNEIEMKKIGDKSRILSPIMGFQMQNPFRKPSDSRTHDYLKQFVNEGVLEVEGEYKGRKYKIK